MPTPTVRISPKSHKLLSELAEELSTSMPQVLDKALETYRRELFLRAANADLTRLKTDRRAWKAYRQELAAVDATVGDGLPEE